MNRRRIGFMLVGAGIVLALIAGVLVYMQASEVDSLREAQPKRGAVVALNDIPERSIITPEQIGLTLVQDAAIPPGAAFYFVGPGAQAEAAAAEARKKVEGQFTPQRIFKGEVINTERLGREAAKASPAFEVPAGKVWYHFPASQNMLIATLDLVRPGDFIDIYFTTEEGPPASSQAPGASIDQLRRLYTRRIMQNVKVLNVGMFPKGTITPPANRVITLEVTPDEALTLKWLKDAANVTGSLELVIRSPQDTQLLPPTTVDYQTISRQYGIGTER